MSSISEAVKNHDDTKIFRPADYDDFMRWLDYADTEEKLFSRLGYWMVMQGLPDDRNQKYDMVRERAQELKTVTKTLEELTALEDDWPSHSTKARPTIKPDGLFLLPAAHQPRRMSTETRCTLASPTGKAGSSSLDTATGSTSARSDGAGIASPSRCAARR